MMSLFFKAVAFLMIVDILAFALLIVTSPIWLRLVVQTEWFENKCEIAEEGWEIIKEKFEKVWKKC